MADILKITTPLVNKNNQIQPNRPVPDATAPFILQDVETVTRPATQEEILQQNNGMLDKENTSSNVLTSLLKDPSATVGFLKNIFVLQELVKLLPANNSTVTQEIEQMFNALLIRPEDIASEMLKQENASTTFKGELFNYLRGLLGENNSAEMRSGIASLLKSINNLISRQDALNAVSNSLRFLSQSLEPSRGLSQRLAQLAREFRGEDAAGRFPQLKGEVLALLKEVEGSLLFSPKMEKVNAITLYNLSRFNDNPDFFQESVSNLLLMLDGGKRPQLAALLREFRDKVGAVARQDESQIMDVLTKIIGKQASENELSASSSEKIEKIIYSLLSSPCHFTPLLHFVVPVEFDFLKAFAEIWINPNGGEDRRGSERTDKRCTHMLLVFDIEGIGQFEAELYAIDDGVEVSLFCPPAYQELFAKERGRLERCIAGTSYHMTSIRVDKLERPRSLMDVFKSLPYKRTGVNVKV